ncbi:MAG: orotate phosphoribosyltransferase [Synergistaceae bacterium]|jgi:orotate phosphoribosyltransferase|nr:orotate phosphoribosyltransferase [Synergistaceae bacterium]
MCGTEKKTALILERLGVLQSGHFRLTSGRHSDKYMQCARLFEHPQETTELCFSLAENFREDGVSLVAGPALGGIIMAYEVARALGVRNVFAERENGVMTFRRGFSIFPGDRVLVVEDVVTTGGSAKEVVSLVREAGGEVAGVGAIVVRSTGTVEFGAPFHPLLSLDVLSWDEKECPLCRDGVPIVKPGSREFKRANV